MPEHASRLAGVSPSVFKRVDEMSYATVENHARYRLILRYLYEQSQVPRDWIAPEEIHAHVAAHLGEAYSDLDCENDLRYLCSKGNLLPEQEKSRARTVEEFQRRRTLYQITPTSVALERTLVELEQAHGNQGSLDSSLLERLWTKLRALREILEARPIGDPGREYLQYRLRGTWEDAFGDFSELRKNANAFHLSLKTLRPEDMTDARAFLIYKDALSENLRHFVQHLMQYAGHVRTLLEGFEERGMDDLLIADATLADLRYFPTPDGTPLDPAVVEAHYRQQYDALSGWFREGGGGEVLRRATRENIKLILQHALRLAGRFNAGASRLNDLRRLAEAFANCPTADDAHRLAAATLGCSTPRHFLGSIRQTRFEEDRSIWEQDPEEVALRVVRRGRRARRQTSEIPDNAADQHRLMTAEMNRRAKEREQWNALFRDGEVRLGEVEVSDPSMRDALLSLVGKCLAAANRSATAPDGTRVRLEVPNPAAPPGTLVSGEGELVTPRYRLVREEAVA